MTYTASMCSTLRNDSPQPLANDQSVIKSSPYEAEKSRWWSVRYRAGPHDKSWESHGGPVTHVGLFIPKDYYSVTENDHCSMNLLVFLLMDIWQRTIQSTVRWNQSARQLVGQSLHEILSRVPSYHLRPISEIVVYQCLPQIGRSGFVTYARVYPHWP